MSENTDKSRTPQEDAIWRDGVSVGFGHAIIALIQLQDALEDGDISPGEAVEVLKRYFDTLLHAWATEPDKYPEPGLPSVVIEKPRNSE